MTNEESNKIAVTTYVVDDGWGDAAGTNEAGPFYAVEIKARSERKEVPIVNGDGYNLLELCRRIQPPSYRVLNNKFLYP